MRLSGQRSKSFSYCLTSMNIFKRSNIYSQDLDIISKFQIYVGIYELFYINRKIFIYTRYLHFYPMYKILRQTYCKWLSAKIILQIFCFHLVFKSKNILLIFFYKVLYHSKLLAKFCSDIMLLSFVTLFTHVLFTCDSIEIRKLILVKLRHFPMYDVTLLH